MTGTYPSDDEDIRTPLPAVVCLQVLQRVSTSLFRASQLPVETHVLGGGRVLYFMWTKTQIDCRLEAPKTHLAFGNVCSLSLQELISCFRVAWGKKGPGLGKD